MPDAYGITQSDEWRRRYRALIAEAQLRRIHYMLFGDSLLEGYNATDRWGTAYWALTRDAIQPKLGNGGSGYLSFGAAPSASASPPDPITEVGVWTAITGGLSTNLVGDQFEGLIIPDVRGEKVELWWTPLSGAGPVLAQAAGKQTHNAVQAQSLVPRAVVAATGADAPRDVLLFIEAGGDQILNGLEGLNPTGVVFDNVSHFGVTSAFVAQPGYLGAPAQDTVGNFLLLPTMTSYHRPDVFVYALGTNDDNLGVPPATFRAFMRQALDLALRRNPDVLFVMVVEHPGTGSLGDFEDFVAELYDAADDYDGAVVDLWARSGESQSAPWATGPTNYFDDGLHFNDVGSAWAAESFIELFDQRPAALIAA